LEAAGEVVVSSYWLHLGYANLKTWALGVLLLHDHGVDNIHGSLLHTLTVAGRDGFFSTSINMFSELPWQDTMQVQLYQIVDPACALSFEELTPDTVFVRALTDIVAGCVWKGAREEDRRLRAGATKHPRKRTRGAAGPRPARAAPKKGPAASASAGTRAVDIGPAEDSDSGHQDSNKDSEEEDSSTEDELEELLDTGARWSEIQQEQDGSRRAA
jgi:hypothetical protein